MSVFVVCSQGQIWANLTSARNVCGNSGPEAVILITSLVKRSWKGVTSEGLVHGGSTFEGGSEGGVGGILMYNSAGSPVIWYRNFPAIAPPALFRLPFQSYMSSTHTSRPTLLKRSPTNR
jgi:hypothetical protein